MSGIRSYVVLACKVIDIFLTFLRGRYVARLEEEIAREHSDNVRLREENRALLNSLLGTAGFPPIETPDAPKPQPLPRLRKRSWHQLQAWKETAAAASDSRSSATPG